MAIRVLLVDDHAMFRAGIKALIEAEDRIEVVGEASTGDEGVDKVRELKPDIVIMDLSMPGSNGLEAGGGWYYHEFVVSDFVALSDQLKVRFVASDEGAGSLVEAAVDDFQVTRFSCAGTSPGDIDNSGDVDLADYAALSDCLAGPPAPVTHTPPWCADDCLGAFDADEDQDLDLADVAAFQTLFATTYGP